MMNTSLNTELLWENRCHLVILQRLNLARVKILRNYDNKVMIKVTLSMGVQFSKVLCWSARESNSARFPLSYHHNHTIHGTCHIAGNFWGRKLLQIRCGMPKISWRKLLWVAVKSWNSWRFSPSKVSRYTVDTTILRLVTLFSVTINTEAMEILCGQFNCFS